VIGYVGAGSAAHFYDVPPSHLDEVIGPADANESTAALEIRGESLGPFFNRWYLFYDDVRRPMTSDLVGQLCVVGLADGRHLIKQCSAAATSASTACIPLRRSPPPMSQSNGPRQSREYRVVPAGELRTIRRSATSPFSHGSGKGQRYWLPETCE
jgi:hypothetical protein